MKWIDTLDIVLALIDEHPDVDPLTVRFTELNTEALLQFDDEPERVERILEAIQMTWIDEMGLAAQTKGPRSQATPHKYLIPCINLPINAYNVAL